MGVGVGVAGPGLIPGRGYRELRRGHKNRTKNKNRYLKYHFNT